jgi:hypothetical protein
LSPHYSPPVFWSNSAKFLEHQSWADRTEFIPALEASTIIPGDDDEVSDLRYSENDEHFEEYQAPLDDLLELDENSNGTEQERPKQEDHKDLWSPERYLFNTTNIKPANLAPTVKQALEGPDALHWRAAIKKELDGLETMGTWEVVDRPKDTNVVGSKMILKVKTDANMIPIKYKARFVAQGFSQQEGVDFEEIFAPVAPIDTIRCLLTVAAVLDWEVDCIDVVQAYLISKLHHDVYLKPVTGLGPVTFWRVAPSCAPNARRFGDHQIRVFPSDQIL